MTEPTSEVKETTTRAGNTVERTTQVREGKGGEEHTANVADRIIWLIAGLIIALLGFRFVLAMLGANPENAFANFIYTLSQPFVAPFFGMFSYDSAYTGVGRFELYTLIAMVVYLFIAWGISKIVNINRD